MKKVLIIFLTIFLLATIDAQPSLLVTETTGGTYQTSLEFSANPSNLDVEINNTALKIFVPAGTGASFGISNSGTFGYVITSVIPASTLNAACGLPATHDLVELEDNSLRTLGNLTAGASISLFSYTSAINGSFVYDNADPCISAGLGNNSTNFDPDGTSGTNPAVGIDLNGSTILPIELTTFTAEKRDVAAELTWETATEINSSHFEIERSGNSKDWETIGKVQAQNQSNRKTSYDYDDLDAASYAKTYKGDVYYRLKMVDQDGSYEYSHVRSLRYEGRAFSMQTYPNPSTDRITVDITGYETSNRTSITIVDHKGAIVQYIPMDTSLKTVDTKTLGLSPGVYQMILTEGDQYIEQQRVVILK